MYVRIGAEGIPPLDHTPVKQPSHFLTAFSSVHFLRCSPSITAKNELGGSIPQSISQLRSITWLNLSDNKLTGKLPRAIGACTRLKALDVSDNSLIGMLPVTLNRLVNLTELHCHHNCLEGDLQTSFAEGLRYCEELRIFDISSNPRLRGTDKFGRVLRRLLPSCCVFVGSPAVSYQTAIQSYESGHVVRPATPQQLEPLDEDAWECSFGPPWNP